MMQQAGAAVLAATGFWMCFDAVADPTADRCPRDSVLLGTTCIDKYEAGIWDLAPTSDSVKRRLVARIRKGTVTQPELLAAGAIQRGVSGDDYGPSCENNGSGCMQLYAVSLAGVTPSQHMTWFQAAAAARNSGKRLPTNAEWQTAALGTPDTPFDDEITTCNTSGPPFEVAATGSRSECRSDSGAFDMTGNVHEWVADWIPLSTACGTWEFVETNFFSENDMCLAGADDATGPGALIRGGAFNGGPASGIFAVNGTVPPSSDAFGAIGFRAIR